jgi:hypothetical protein
MELLMNNGIYCAILVWRGWNMSYPDRERIEVEEEAAQESQIVVKTNGAPNGTAGNRPAAGARSQRIELAALGWDVRRRRLRLK